MSICFGSHQNEDGVSGMRAMVRKKYASTSALCSSTMLSCLEFVSRQVVCARDALATHEQQIGTGTNLNPEQTL